MYLIKAEEKPREKLLAAGAAHLTDLELVSVILGSGIEGRPIHLLARDVLTALDRANYKIDIHKFMAMPGLGMAKVSLLAAVCELASRIYRLPTGRIQTASDVIRLVNHFADRKQECFVCISLNGAYEVISRRIISIGLLNRTMVHPREVFAEAIVERAAAIICAHNHPSGNISPSGEDRAVTTKLVAAGKLIGIQLLDHVIFTKEKYYSFQEEGELQ